MSRLPKSAQIERGQRRYYDVEDDAPRPAFSTRRLQPGAEVDVHQRIKPGQEKFSSAPAGEEHAPLTLDMALRWANRGVPVFRLHHLAWDEAGDLVCTCSAGSECGRNSGKHPYRGGVHDASTDESTIRSWWGKRSRAHVGLATGHPLDRSGSLVVVDVDSVDALWALWADQLLVDTYMVRTGSGWHFYFRSDEPISCQKRNLGIAKVDIRGVGGQVVAPGCRHLSGRMYVADREFSPGAVARLPTELTKRLVARGSISSRISTSPRVRRDPIGGELPALQNIPPGLRWRLDQNLPTGFRSEAAFGAINYMVKVGWDDEVIAGTIRSNPVGLRYLEPSRSPLAIYDEIDRARQKGEPSTEERETARQRLVDAYEAAARRDRSLRRKGQYRTLVGGLYYFARQRGVPQFCASQKELAIQAGVSPRTVRAHIQLLVAGGWIRIVWAAERGSQHATRYQLCLPGGAVSLPPSNPHPLLCKRGEMGSVASGDIAGAAAPADGERDPPREADPDFSVDPLRYAATGAVWKMLPYVTQEEETDVASLVRRSGASRSTVFRWIKRADDLGLLEERPVVGRGIRLRLGCEQRLEEIAVEKETAGMKARATKELQRERLMRSGDGEMLDDGIRVVHQETGEIV